MIFGKYKSRSTPPTDIGFCRKGSAVLIMSLMAGIVLGSVALAISVTYNSVYSAYKASASSLQAQQYAAGKMNLLGLSDYKDLAAQNKKTISGTDFLDSVTVYPAVDEGDGVTSKTVTVSVYKQGDSRPRAEISRKFYSKTKSASEVFGTPIILATSGTFTAPDTGLICAAGSKKGSSLNIQVGGKTLGYVVGRDYGTGNISACVPVNKGQTVTISGYCAWAYLVPMNI